MYDKQVYMYGYPLSVSYLSYDKGIFTLRKHKNHLFWKSTCIPTCFTWILFEIPVEDSETWKKHKKHKRDLQELSFEVIERRLYLAMGCPAYKESTLPWPPSLHCSSGLVSSPAWAAITTRGTWDPECLKWQKLILSHFWRLEIQGQCQQVWFLLRLLSLACRWPPSLCVLIWSVFLIRTPHQSDQIQAHLSSTILIFLLCP